MPTAGEYKHELTGNPCQCYLKRRARNLRPMLKSCLRRRKVVSSLARHDQNKSKTVTFDPVLQIQNYDNLEEKQKLVLANVPLPNLAVRRSVVVSKVPTGKEQENRETEKPTSNCSGIRASRTPIQSWPSRLDLNAAAHSRRSYAVEVNFLEEQLQVTEPLSKFSFFQPDFSVSRVLCEYEGVDLFVSSEEEKEEELTNKKYVNRMVTPAAKTKNTWLEGLQCKLEMRKRDGDMLPDFGNSGAVFRNMKLIAEEIEHAVAVDIIPTRNGNTKKISLLYEFLRVMPIAFFCTGCTFLITLIYVLMYPVLNEE